METSPVGVDLSLAPVRLVLAFCWLCQVDASAGTAGDEACLPESLWLTIHYLYPRQHQSMSTDLDNAISAAVAGVVVYRSS